MAIGPVAAVLIAVLAIFTSALFLGWRRERWISDDLTLSLDFALAGIERQRRRHKHRTKLYEQKGALPPALTARAPTARLSC